MAGENHSNQEPGSEHAAGGGEELQVQLESMRAELGQVCVCVCVCAMQQLEGTVGCSSRAPPIPPLQPGCCCDCHHLLERLSI